MRRTKAGILCLLAFLLLLANTVAAQDNSPYSRYGLGDLNLNQNVINRGMGGVSQAYSDPQSVNFVNPASYSNLVLTTFDIAVEGGARVISNNDKNFRSGLGSLSYIQLGVPLARKWGMVLGLRPVTKVSYNIMENTEQTFFDTLKMPVAYQYEGNGGLYQVYAGTGVGIGGFSIGANVGYLFGNIENSTKAIYPSNQFIFPSRHTQRVSYGHLFYNIGLQYRIDLGKEMDLTLGATGSLKQNLSGRREQMRETLAFDGASNDYITQDTVLYEKGERGKIIYPQQLGGGIVLRKQENWTFGLDFTTEQWDQYRNFGEKDSVRNAWKMAAGGQFVPNARAINGYWNKVTYRVGGYYGVDYLKLNGQDMPVFGFSIGAGLPVRRQPYSNQFSVINVAFEVGHRGNNQTVLKETWYRMVLGFTLNDRWFIKRKYD
ncbi:hypothetical protein F0L74_01830 [Chitinophaga agrisoli]|uniref:Long-subunit fatty acid transport protein n=1 Tax=Chitinophaga agrisoli TaxID=2607653 RepID=A0A5B2W1F5_9BACT|nr:hypothetical protein [Chitinophaga agrisoli]KAA2244738.1 hypothetical protein F0L74_01830 [Chitinophaga agrisoli]